MRSLRPLLFFTLLTWSAPVDAQTYEQLAQALNNVQHEMCTCIAFYVSMADCLSAKKDAALREKATQSGAVLLARAAEIGKTLNITEDATRSRIAMSLDENSKLLNGSCSNASSILYRHAQRCKRLIENGDSILDEYMKKGGVQ
jgi:hypothetical protein